jgi:hypothetical protein
MVCRHFLIAPKEHVPEWPVEHQYPTEAWQLHWIVGAFQVNWPFKVGTKILVLGQIACRTARLTRECHFTGSNNLGGY